MRTWMAIACIGLAGLAGCSGEYRLTMPDQVAPTDGQAAAVARLERNEFAGLMMPVKNVPIARRVEESPLAAGYTDPQGYMALNVPTGQRLGRYYVHVTMQDNRGVELERYVPLYVWDPTMSVVAVELEAVTSKDGAGARAALAKIASNAYLVYFTTEPVLQHGTVHRQLQAMNLPDGAVMSWKQEAWHFSGQGMAQRLVVEDRLVNPLAYLRMKFPHLKYGLCSSPVAAKAFVEAGMKVVTVSQEKGAPASAIRKSWADLAKTGL